MAKQLTPQQARFCSYYIESGNGKQSALKAGYSDSTANNANLILNKSAVKERIKQHEDNLLRSSNWNKDRIISELEHVYSLAIADNQLTNASKVLELLAKLTNSMPSAQTKEVNHHVKFESLLKDITPQNKTISDSYETKLIN
jgi:phage terminase small subunit